MSRSAFSASSPVISLQGEKWAARAGIETGLAISLRGIDGWTLYRPLRCSLTELLLFEFLSEELERPPFREDRD
jgi:hypothetical protein